MEFRSVFGECCVSCQKLLRFKCFDKSILFSLTETKNHGKKCPTQRQDLLAAFSTRSHHQLLIYRCFVMRHFSFIQTCPLVLMADTLSPVILHSTLALSRFAKYDVRRHLFMSSENKVGDFALQVH